MHAPRIPPAFVFLLLGAACHAADADRLKIDFQSAASPPKFERLDFSRVEATIVAAAAEGPGRCLRLHNASPATECGMAIKGPIAMEKNLTLSFDHREEIEPGFAGAYLGMSFRVDGKQWFWTSDDFSGQWRHVDVKLAMLPRGDDHRLHLDTVFSNIHIYGRVKETTNVKTATKARMTVWFDHIRLHTGPVASRLSAVVRQSYSNPAMFIWAPMPGVRHQRLQYSLDQGFPEQASRTVEVPWNFYTPSEPMRPGTWYWRTSTESELTSGWSEIQTIVIPPEAHRFTTAAIPIDNLTGTPRPRLLPMAKVDEPEVTAQRKAQLVKLAKGIYRRGVPEHPGPHVPGDPRWPTWVDWYGKVAGGITGGTGMRLQKIAGYAMLTRDPQVIAWSKELALAACKWDPEGGSAMKLGDIGAHHLLRGLSWCYDACYDTMTPAERATLRKIIVARAGQFWDHLNPFRGSEANNHAWLNTLALGEAGIVLLGDHAEAAQWAEYSRQLYLGRFLCCLGYQGDNNEGISYWGYGLGFVTEYSDLLKTVCGIDLFAHPWLKQTARFPMYCAPPNAWAVSFADTGMPNHGTRGPAQTDKVLKLAVRTHDPYALWYSGQREPLDGLVPRPPLDLPQSIHYRHIGVVIFNTSLVDGRDGVTVAMHSGRYWAGHQHADQNHFVIHAYGEKLAIDGGYYDWYGSPHFNAYSMQTLAHNTLLVNGRGQADRTVGADGRVAAWFDSPGYGYTVGDASKPEIYRGLLKQFDRRILFIKPGFVVIHDMVASAGAAARYDWLLHAIVPIELDRAGKAFRIPCAAATLRGQFFRPAKLALEVKTGFPADPVNRYSTNPVPKDNYFPEWILYATPEQPQAREEFLAAMQIERGGPHADAAAEMTAEEIAGGRALRIHDGARTHLVLLRSPDSSREKGERSKLPLVFSGLVSDGEVAAVEVGESGKVVRAMAIGATTLSYQGTRLLRSEVPTDWALPGK